MPTLEWIGKKAVLNHHREVPFHLLKCDPALSVGESDSGNLLIQGDNLKALKALLPYYAGKVKCIYIDPPYNTGNEGWTYNDAVNSPEIRSWLGEVVGKEAEDLSRHDKWLCMMYPRLVLLNKFLKEDGIIFVSVDENEHRHAELLLDEVFGSTNRVETIIWKKSYGGGAKSKHIVNLHEYIICFAKKLDVLQKLELPPTEKVMKYYKYRDSKFELRGPFRLQPLATTSMDERPNLRYPIPFEGEEIWPEKQWQWSQERALLALSNDELVIKKTKGEWSVSYKQYLKDDQGMERTSKPYSIIEGIYTQKGTNEIKAMFGDGKAFAFPKPSDLIMNLIRMNTGNNDIIMDSFAGSGTTGHAVLKLNAQGTNQRKFILIEMDSDIAKTITHNRLSLAITGYESKYNKKEIQVDPLGGGFSYCSLDGPLFTEKGGISDEVSFEKLASFVFFSEFGLPIENHNPSSPLLGIHNGVAVYLLFNGILGDKRVDGGNVLTGPVLASLPPHDGPKVIYGEGCRFSSGRLRRENIVFKQIPYQIKVD